MCKVPQLIDSNKVFHYQVGEESGNKLVIIIGYMSLDSRGLVVHFVRMVILCRAIKKIVGNHVPHISDII